MSSFHVLGIGGSGTKGIEAFIHLMSAGIAPKDVDLGFLDQDTTNGNLIQTQRVIRLYQNLHDKLAADLAQTRPACPLFKAGINKRSGYSRPVPVWQPIASSYETMASLFQNSLLRREARHMLNCLYDPDNELTLDLVHGFRGRPAIGQAVLAAGAHNGLPFWRDMEAKLRDAEQSAEDQKYFMIGSVFGGTGAAGIPSVARWLARDLARQQRRGETAIGATLMLPYFRYPDDVPGGEVSKGRLPPSATMLARTRFALEYYRMHLEGVASRRDHHRKFDALYVIGWPEMINLHYESSGGQEQRNPALMVELLAALAAAHFSSGCPEADADADADAGVGRVYRAGYVGDTIDWDDLPSPVPGKSGELVMRQLATLVRFAFTYKYIYHESIFGENAKEEYHDQVWYCNLLGKSKLDYDLGWDLYQYCDILLRWVASLSLQGENPKSKLFNVNTKSFADLIDERNDAGFVTGRRILLYEEFSDKKEKMVGTERNRYLPYEHIKEDIGLIFENLINWPTAGEFLSLKEIYNFMCTNRPEQERSAGFAAFVQTLWLGCELKQWETP
jgi:hypothetical protein